MDFVKYLEDTNWLRISWGTKGKNVQEVTFFTSPTLHETRLPSPPRPRSPSPRQSSPPESSSPRFSSSSSSSSSSSGKKRSFSPPPSTSELQWMRVLAAVENIAKTGFGEEFLTNFKTKVWFFFLFLLFSFFL